jgi:hypothetical protein
MMTGRATATLLIDNDRVRVTRWRFAPGAATGWHTHEDDYVIVPLTDGTLKLSRSRSFASSSARRCASTTFWSVSRHMLPRLGAILEPLVLAAARPPHTPPHATGASPQPFVLRARVIPLASAA